MPTLKTFTLGCKVNQYETELVRQALARLGYREPAPGEPADLCVVNTCTVTAEADRKSRKRIRRLACQNPGARIVVMGCYATRRASEVAALPGVSEVLTDKRALPEWLAGLGLCEIPSGITSFGPRHRAYVKIQDGCQMECAYCIIPQTRPVLASRPIDEVVEEVRGLVDAGYREIVLTGIHLGHYGIDLERAPEPTMGCLGHSAAVAQGPDSPGHRCAMARAPVETEDYSTNLARLLRRLVAVEGSFRLRISSIEAAEVTAELLDVMAEHPRRVCPHLHVSMQSGSDAVLRRMRRRQTSDEFLKQCQRIKQRLDRPGLTTDVIVGFPGETDADFEATCRAVETVGFSKIHVFRFSPRPGTAAAQMTDTVTSEIQRQRAARLTQIEQNLRTSYFESLLGEELSVLVESTDADRPGTLLGTSARYVPVALPGLPQLLGHLVRARALAVAAGRVQSALASAEAIC